MSAMAVAQRMTADEYLAVPYRGVRTQLVEGEVVLQDPTYLHQIVLADLYVALREWTSAAPGRGSVSWPIDVKLDERNVFGPDLMWYAEGRAPARHDQRPYPLPDIVAEARSPSTWRYDIGSKKAAYERAGLAELWLLDTAADEIIVFRRGSSRTRSFDVSLQLAGADALTTPLLPGFALDLRALFAG